MIDKQKDSREIDTDKLSIGIHNIIYAIRQYALNIKTFNKTNIIPSIK